MTFTGSETQKLLELIHNDEITIYFKFMAHEETQTMLNAC